MLFPWLDILPRLPYLHPEDKEKSHFFGKQSLKIISKYYYFPNISDKNLAPPSLSPPLAMRSWKSLQPWLFLQGSPLRHDVSSGIIISNQSLVVQRVTRSDAGQYTCHVFNSEGEGVSNEVHLAVKCRKLNSLSLQIDVWELPAWAPPPV